MSTNYTGNPATPSLGSGVTIVEPADGDAATAASVNNPGPHQQFADLIALAALGALPGQTIASGTPLPTFSPPVLIDLNSGAKQAVSYQLLWSYALASGTSKRHIRAFMRGDGVLTLTLNANVFNNGAGSGWWTADDPAYASTAMWIGGDLGAQSTNDAGGVAFAIVANQTSKAYSGMNNSWSEVLSGFSGTGWGSYAQLGTASQGSAGQNYSFGNGVNGLNFGIGGNPSALGSWQFNKALTCGDATGVSQFPLASAKTMQVAHNLVASGKNIPSGGFAFTQPTSVTAGSGVSTPVVSFETNASENAGQVNFACASTAFSGVMKIFGVANASGLAPETINVFPMNSEAAGMFFSGSAVNAVGFAQTVSGGWEFWMTFQSTNTVSVTGAVFGYQAIY